MTLRDIHGRCKNRHVATDTSDRIPDRGLWEPSDPRIDTPAGAAQREAIKRRVINTLKHGTDA